MAMGGVCFAVVLAAASLATDDSVGQIAAGYSPWRRGPCDVRFPDAPFSLMIPASEAAHLVVLVPDQLGLLVHPGRIGENELTNRRNLDVAPLGLSGGWLETPETHWLRAIRATRAGTLCQANLHAFAAGQPAGRKT